MPLRRHLLARFSAKHLSINTKRVSPLRKPVPGAKSGLGEKERQLPGLTGETESFLASRLSFLAREPPVSKSYCPVDSLRPDGRPSVTS
jgi:hypothetical protein